VFIGLTDNHLFVLTTVVPFDPCEVALPRFLLPRGGLSSAWSLKEPQNVFLPFSPFVPIPPKDLFDLIDNRCPGKDASSVFVISSTASRFPPPAT